MRQLSLHLFCNLCTRMCLRIVSRVLRVFPSICFLVCRTVWILLTTALLRSRHELLGDAPSPRCFRFYESELANDGWWNPYLFSRTWTTICGSSSQVGRIFSHHLRTTDRILLRRSKLAGMNSMNPMNPVGSQYFLIPLFLCLTRENCQTKLPFRLLQLAKQVLFVSVYFA